MWVEVYDYLASNIYESLISIVVSGLSGLGIAVYLRKLDHKKKEHEDEKSMEAINEYTRKAQEIYNNVQTLSDRIPEATDSQLRKINSFLERESDELKRIHDAIFDYSLKLNQKKPEQEQRIQNILTHVDWLAKEYFRSQLDKEARKSYFIDYRDELSTRRTELSSLRTT